MHPADYFKFCPSCGFTALVISSTRNPFYCTKCSFEYYFNPAVAAAAFILRENGEVLFVERAREPARGKLGLPGGFIDLGETAEEAVRREILEEVGIKINELNYLFSFPNSYEYHAVTYSVLDLFYLIRVKDNEQATALEETSNVLWLPLKAVAEERLAFQSIQKALKLLQSSVYPRNGG